MVQGFHRERLVVAGFVLAVIGLMLPSWCAAQIELPKDSLPGGKGILPESQKPGQQKKKQIAPPPPAPRPVITGFKSQCLGGGVLAVRGRYFGSQQSKSISVRIDGNNVGVRSWADGQIEISVPYKTIDENHRYRVEIFKGPAPVTSKTIRGCASKSKLAIKPGGSREPDGTAVTPQQGLGITTPTDPGLRALSLPDLTVALRIETNRPQAQITVRNASQTSVPGYTLDVFPAMDALGRAPVKRGVPITGKTHGMLPAGGQRQHTAGLPDEGRYLCASVKAEGKDARPSNNRACAPLRQHVAQGGPSPASPASPGLSGQPTGIGVAIAKSPSRTKVPSPDTKPGPVLGAIRPPNIEGAQPISGHAPPNLGRPPTTEAGEALGRELDTIRPARPIRLNRLLVNGRTDQVGVRPGEGVTISWDIRDVGDYAGTGNPIMGIYLGISESPSPVQRGDARGNRCASNLPGEEQYGVSGFVSGGR
ncbi:MAG: IPT/TIG domain-containing protein, partial [Gammaproteobacteria bacterium]|nr:IPT/TIG domain-containing protein [Gammaproteobacteria bacterium]